MASSELPKNGAADSSRPIAFLVDAENAATYVKHEHLASLVKEMLAEASKYGPVIIRRMYGNWTSPTMASWKSVQEQFALKPIQQFAYVSGKNATDSALIIEAMDMLHGGIVKGFCLVSSDSDFTGLATRIREGGLFVMVIGGPTTLPALRNACDVFVSYENLLSEGQPTKPQKVPSKKETVPMPSGIAPAVEGRPNVKKPTDALPVLLKALENTADENGRAHLAELGNAARRLDPGFDPRSYGMSKLVDLIASFHDQFEIERPGGKGPGVVYVLRRSNVG